LLRRLAALTDRKALARAIATLGAGDVLLVTRLDRLARSTRDLLNVLDTIVKAGAGFKSLADAWADTTTAHGRLMLTVLSGLAEFERELIRARTDEGRKRAQARGVRFGRKLKLTAHQRAEAIARRAAGEALAEIGRSYNVSHSTISRLLALALKRSDATIQLSARFAPTDGHNSPGIMVAPIAGTSRGMGTTIGAALYIGGEESGPDLAVFIKEPK
jgi:DNA invertase Pin-like site-specific DNA recombinase